ncbi:MAG TPA: sugar transferase [Patescibacteria group bacterium]|nr:sugar transferase [Patescibacteria group bacterium]
MSNEIQLVPLPLAKRILDVLATSIIFLLLTPFFLFLLLFIAIEQIFIKDSRGPFLYSEKRISGGQVFNFYKWRTFKVTAIEAALKAGPVIHTANLQKDLKNLTYYGRLLKRIYMDESPQLWNVLKGDMTLVGPRPTNLENSTNYKNTGDFTREIIKCGLTGPYQSEKGHAVRSQLELDRDYINFVSANSGWKVVFKDLTIILKTIRIVLEAKGI